MGLTAGPAGEARCRWHAGSACAVAGRSPGAVVLDVAGAWGFAPSVGLLARGVHGVGGPGGVKPVRTPVAILGSLGVCIYVPASRQWLISYSPIHLT